MLLVALVKGGGVADSLVTVDRRRIAEILEEEVLWGVGLPVQSFDRMSGLRCAFGLSAERTGLMMRGFVILTCSIAVSVIRAKSLSIGGCG